MKRTMILIAALLLAGGQAQAKWWIFGKANSDVSLKYVYVNKVPADEAGSEIKLFKEALPPDGTVKITGKAALGKGRVGSVRISLDGKETWQDVKFAEDGTFEHSFKPEAGRTYTMLIEVTDTAGKTNAVEDTRKRITLSAENVQAKVREALDALCDAYDKEDAPRFMAGVGEDFTGDKGLLERAIKKDFDALNNISLRYTINNVAAGAQGRIFVSVTYNRMVFVNKTGASSTDKGVTEFVFGAAGDKLTLYSMKQPLIFGLSDADNVATGTVLGENPGEALVLDESGDLGGPVSITCSGVMPTIHAIYWFATGETGCHPQDDGMMSRPSDIIIYNTGMEPHNGLQAKTFAGRSLSSLTAAEVRDPAGYAATNPYPVIQGSSYGISVGGRYYGIEFTVIPEAVGTQNTTFKVRSF